MHRGGRADRPAGIVGCDGNVVDIGEGGDLADLGEAAGVHQIGLHDAAAGVFEQLAVLEARQQAFTGRDRRGDVALQLRHRLGILERDRLLEPPGAKRRERAIEKNGAAR
jgi:hypothetical protein